ncbi:YheV family putative zinc ribbon protein [Agarilytica rhodophyticola]|uniref:YheV family putative zinc ribbon protein n=1 Tax=Agarilytica rhodophyticola TaxID=1737490 RepID=UPI000B341FF4|nr:YheV family putative zinc ribbon protein [Agarilytica rhodophyticola]
MNKKLQKRFIAGAVCPQCAAMDTLIMFKENDEEYRECVDCGFKDKLIFKSQMGELTTRVNKTEEDIKNETQVVKLVDINSKK